VARSKRTKEAPAIDTTTPSAPTPSPPAQSIAKPARPHGESYTVVARRYRPQRFEDVVGQDHVVQALRNAIRLNRVTHAYLFSGTRGVGKTSIARIFAKCLNCAQGPTETPCNACDICHAISIGQDVDVIEIDGASNNGVEQVRELRQNASLRPSRARFKIYYIDEVHMLSTGAFNALLKTLEEPPEHVKFFFATTEPNKIPITVVSRCQRYDFAGVRPDAITNTLAEICRREGVEADRSALTTIARRAAGSLRDAQSLLEQLLSYGDSKLTAQVVHDALGLAPDERVLDLIEALAHHQADRALTILDDALASGVQAADFLNSALEFLRDVMVLSAGAPHDLVSSAPGVLARLKAIAETLSLDTILAALQIFAEARARLRGTPHGRLVVELALCRVARLEDLVELGELVERLNRPTAAPPPSPEPIKKKLPTATPSLDPSRVIPRGDGLGPRAAPALRLADPGDDTPPPTAADSAADAKPSTPAEAQADFSGRPIDLPTLTDLWPILAAQLGAPLGTNLARLVPHALPAPGVLVVSVPPAYNWAADSCDSGDGPARIEAALRDLLGRPLKLQFARSGEAREPVVRSPQPAVGPLRHPDLERDPLVQDIVKLFEARPVRVEVDDEEPA
jgi:DNA polymerase-3 subunit gamma/tau